MQVLRSDSPHPSEIRSQIIIPAHNRRELTLGCLRLLHDAGVADWATVCVVDDGSTDGTSDAIRNEFPNVVILPGNGNLWWGGAIRAGMELAVERGADLIFWLNDDCRPSPDCLTELRDACLRTGLACTAQARTPSGWIYGGVIKTCTGLRPLRIDGNEPQPCDAFMGNCVCIPAATAKQINLVDAGRFPHGLADVDFGLRLKRHGFASLVIPTATATNADNHHPTVTSWLRSEIPLEKIWSGLFDLKSALHLRTTWNFYVRHWGVWGMLLFLRIYAKLTAISVLRLLLPRSILQKL